MSGSLPVIILGAGGHAKVLVNALLLGGIAIEGICDTDPVKHGLQVLGVPVLGGEEILSRHAPEKVLLVNGIGSVSGTQRRREIFTKFTRLGYHFLTVVHPSAVVAPDAQLEEGAQIMAGAVIQPGCVIGPNCIVNTAALVDHDCRLGAHVHLCPGTTLSGGVTIQEGAHLGAGAVVIQLVKIGERAVIGAGAVVLGDVAEDAKVAGVPAKPIG